MRKAKKINPKAGLAMLLAGSLISLLILAYASTVTSPVPQTLALLVSMGLLFYSSHPLGHYIVARILGVTVDYFYFGRSDFRKLNMAPAKMIGSSLPTIGTKLNRPRLESLAPRKRGYIFGSGAILSSILVGLQSAYTLLAGFGLLATLLGAVFFLGNLGLQLMFSTRVGDLSKMKMS